MEWNAPQELQGNERKGGKAFRSLLDSVGPKWLGCLSKSKQMLGVIGEFATEILCLSYFLFLKTLKLHQITMLENASCQVDYHVVLDKWANVLLEGLNCSLRKQESPILHTAWSHLSSTYVLHLIGVKGGKTTSQEEIEKWSCLSSNGPLNVLLIILLLWGNTLKLE